MKNFRRFLVALGLLSSVAISAPAAAQAGQIVYITDGPNLATIDVGTGAVRVIGRITEVGPSMGTVRLDDIAFDPAGNLFGIDITSFYRIDRRTGRAAFIGEHGMGNGGALACGSGGKCFATNPNSNELYEINVRTGLARVIGLINGHSSFGDIAFYQNGFVISSGRNARGRIQRALLTIDRRTFRVLRAVDYNVSGVSGIGGLASINNQIFGFADTAAYRIDPNTGRTTLVASFAGRGLNSIRGAAYSARAQP